MASSALVSFSVTNNEEAALERRLMEEMEEGNRALLGTKVVRHHQVADAGKGDGFKPTPAQRKALRGVGPVAKEALLRRWAAQEAEGRKPLSEMNEKSFQKKLKEMTKGAKK
jgi:hypothetical protein